MSNYFLKGSVGSVGNHLQKCIFLGVSQIPFPLLCSAIYSFKPCHTQFHYFPHAQQEGSYVTAFGIDQWPRRSHGPANPLLMVEWRALPNAIPLVISVGGRITAIPIPVWSSDKSGGYSVAWRAKTPYLSVTFQIRKSTLFHKSKHC